jgi:mRNA interferase MazF
MRDAYEPGQGDIVRMNFDTQAGHEQSGRRPAVVISNAEAMARMNTRAMVCPITNTDKGYPMHVRLDERTQTAGVILCDQAKILDIKARKAEFIESLPKDLLDETIDIVYGIIEPLDGHGGI